MSSTEREHEGTENTSKPYYRAARFATDPPAQRAYQEVEQIIHSARGRADLSAYRVLLDRIPHVTVLGDQPSAEVDAQLTAALSAGEATSLPQNVLTRLLRRRAQAQNAAPWVEGHYRPGRRL